MTRQYTDGEEDMIFMSPPCGSRQRDWIHPCNPNLQSKGAAPQRYYPTIAWEVEYRYSRWDVKGCAVLGSEHGGREDCIF